MDTNSVSATKPIISCISHHDKDDIRVTLYRAYLKGENPGVGSYLVRVPWPSSDRSPRLQKAQSLAASAKAPSLPAPRGEEAEASPSNSRPSWRENPAKSSALPPLSRLREGREKGWSGDRKGKGMEMKKGLE